MMMKGRPLMANERDVLLSLTDDDWAWLNSRELPLDDLAKLLGLHKKLRIDQGFRNLLQARLARMPPGQSSSLVALLSSHLTSLALRSEDVGGFREALPAPLRAVMDLADVSADPTDGDEKDADSPHQSRRMPFTQKEIDSVKSLATEPSACDHAWEGPLKRLEEDQSVTGDKVEQLLTEIREGRRPSATATTAVADWAERWTYIPKVLSSLPEARRQLESELQASSEIAADQQLVMRFVDLAFIGGSEEAVTIIATEQSAAKTLSLPLKPTKREELAALVRVLVSNWPDNDDTQLVMRGFNTQVLMAANQITVAELPPPAIADSSSEPEPVREPEPTLGPDPEGGPGAGFECDAGVEFESRSGDQEPELETEPEIATEPEAEPEPATEPEAEPEPAKLVEPQATTVSIAELPSEVRADPTCDTSPLVIGQTDYLHPFEACATGGDFANAYWYAVAGKDEVRARAARLLVLATSSELAAGNPHTEASMLSALLGADLTDASGPLTEIIAAALVPPALLLPPYSEAVTALNAAATRLGDDCPAFIKIADQLTYERGSGLHSLEAPQLLAARDQARATLEEFRGRANSRTIRFHRATEVWRELIRQQGLLGSLAEAALTDPTDPGLRQRIDKVIARGIARTIRDTDYELNPMQAKRQAITARAKDELTSSIESYLELISRFLAAEESVRAIDRRTAYSTDLIEGLLQVLAKDDEKAGAVSDGVVAWLRDRLAPDQNPNQPPAEAELLARPLARAYELNRRADGSFDPMEVTVDLLTSLPDRTSEQAFVGYTARHDFVGVGVLLEAIRAIGQDADVASFEERARKARLDSREALARELEETRLALARAVSTTSLSDAEAQEHETQVLWISQQQDPHYRDALQQLQRIHESLEQRLGERLRAVSNSLANLTMIDSTARNRVEDLIAARDLLTAEEFVAQLTNGATSLPAEAAQDDSLEQFRSVLGVAESGGPKWFNERLTAGEVAGMNLPHALAQERVISGLHAWALLASSVRPLGWDTKVPEVLAAVGFQKIRIHGRYTAGRATTGNTFEASYDGYALVPTFGSSARGGYALFMCWERKTVEGLLQTVRVATNRSHRPTLVLYFHTLSSADRRTLAEQCRRKGLPFIVIDHAAMAYLGTREEGRFDGLMQVCLPFTGSNPYTPFVLGDVPREVFYGRNDELRQVQDPNGPLFVYGGRQLGKSALLKTAKSDFERFDKDSVSIYLDLKAEGIGEWHKADDLWRVLLPHLKDKEITVGTKLSVSASPESIAKAIGEWLDGNPQRKLLLLLDESDAFLDQDSQPRNAGKGQFKNVYLLKNLMTQSERRFKPVFAGLHQVQRFHKESNGPMAHMGTEIPIGPLPPAEAYKLVVRPLGAIGYRFTKPDVVWRLLSHTNYQASLIQLFCRELVNELNARRLSPGEPPSLIDEQTVDRIYENRELRGQIAQRFEWTIHLDNRYRVIALVAAWLNLAESQSVSAAETLRSECTDFWPGGFESASPDEFEALLKELVGLGVLVRNAQGLYGIRSPNVIRLLGTRDEIERKLMDSSTLELPTVFDPARYRRRLPDNTRSPVTEAQAARLLSRAKEPTVVTASTALGADRLGIALDHIGRSSEGQNGVEVTAVAPDALVETITALSRRRIARHLLLDARGLSETDLQDAITRLTRATRHQSSLSACVLVTPRERTTAMLPEDQIHDLLLKPWSDVELRAVEPETDVPLSAETRKRLLALTGGWPEVLEPVLARGRRTDVLTMLAVAETESEKVLAAGWPTLAERLGVPLGGLDEKVLMSLLEWADPIGRDDLVELLGPLEPGELGATLDGLALSGAVALTPTTAARPATYRLNALVARALKLRQ